MKLACTVLILIAMLMTGSSYACEENETPCGDPPDERCCKSWEECTAVYFPEFEGWRYVCEPKNK